MDVDTELERATERDAKENGYGGYAGEEPSIKCEVCGAENKETARYCWRCYAQLCVP